MIEIMDSSSTHFNPGDNSRDSFLQYLHIGRVPISLGEFMMDWLTKFGFQVDVWCGNSRCCSSSLDGRAAKRFNDDAIIKTDAENVRAVRWTRR